VKKLFESAGILLVACIREPSRSDGRLRALYQLGQCVDNRIWKSIEDSAHM